MSYNIKKLITSNTKLGFITVKPREFDQEPMLHFELSIIILCMLIAFILLEKVSASTANFEQRDFVIKELLETENNYLEVLNALKYKFMQPLEKYLSKDELRTIFPTIKVSCL
jgi:RhoGEF domain